MPNNTSATIEEIEGEEDDFEDETLTERIIGLSEMFPDFVRNAASVAYSSSIKGASAAYKFTRSSLWIIGTSVVILALPVVFEVERVQTEEAQLMQQRQILLGPGASNPAGAMPPMGAPRR